MTSRRLVAAGSLDGRVEHEGTAHDFRFDAGIDEWLSGVLRWRGGALQL